MAIARCWFVAARRTWPRPRGDKCKGAGGCSRGFPRPGALEDTRGRGMRISAAAAVRYIRIMSKGRRISRAPSFVASPAGPWDPGNPLPPQLVQWILCAQLQMDTDINSPAPTARPRIRIVVFEKAPVGPDDPTREVSTAVDIAAGSLSIESVRCPRVDSPRSVVGRRIESLSSPFALLGIKRVPYFRLLFPRRDAPRRPPS